jgi:hypothetical protein
VVSKRGTAPLRWLMLTPCGAMGMETIFIGRVARARDTQRSAVNES